MDILCLNGVFLRICYNYLKMDELIQECHNISDSSEMQEIFPELVKLGKKQNIPVYSVILLVSAYIRSKTASDPDKDDGWVSILVEIPGSLRQTIKNACKKGSVSASEKENIFLKARELQIDEHDIMQIIEFELEKVEEELSRKRKKNRKMILIIGPILLLITALVILYFLVYVPYQIDKNTPRQYVIARNLNLRASPTTASKANILREIPYGTEVKVYETDTMWAKVKVFDLEGYMSHKYLTDKKSLYEMDAIFGNPESREEVQSSNIKNALTDWIKVNGYMGNMPEKFQMEIYGQILNREKWQLFAYNKDANFNIRATGYFIGTTEFCNAVIITNIATKARMLLVFKFDEDDNGQLIFSDYFPEQYDGIKTIQLSSKEIKNYFHDISIRQLIQPNLPIILRGTNDAFSTLTQQIMFYDGQSFLYANPSGIINK